MNRLHFIFLAVAFFSTVNVMAAAETCDSSPRMNAEQAGISCTGSYYDWGRAQNGYGYCYEWTCYGDVLNQGQPVSNYSCEAVRPSYFNWGRAQNGWGYCYQYTPQGLTMNQGQPVSNYSCEQTRPSYYSWGRSQDGSTRCYQYTPQGTAMNQGQPVSEFYCR